ncbi:AraC family transcriptional regulator [Kitasatospora sp. NPDC054939]
MLDRLNQAMEHIERQLDGPVDVAELARIAATSEHHFRRLFSVLAGMPLSEYVRRRRLTVAGADVLAGERTLLEVAVRYGYTSGEAFARAFRAVHGIGPGEARRTGAVLVSQPRMSFRLVVEGRSSMEYRVVEKDAFLVAGRKARVPLVCSGVNPSIAAFIESIPAETVERIGALSAGEPEGIVSVVDDIDENRTEGSDLDYYHAVVARSDAAVPDGFDTLAVPAGSWAVFDGSGPFPQTLGDLSRDVYTEWFPSNPYAARPGPEIMRMQLSADGSQADVQLWIPVERQG